MVKGKDNQLVSKVSVANQSRSGHTHQKGNVSQEGKNEYNEGVVSQEINSPKMIFFENGATAPELLGKQQKSSAIKHCIIRPRRQSFSRFVTCILHFQLLFRGDDHNANAKS